MLHGAFPLLEPYAGKLARAVLRGVGAGNSPGYPTRTNKNRGDSINKEHQGYKRFVLPIYREALMDALCVQEIYYVVQQF